MIIRTVVSFIVLMCGFAVVGCTTTGIEKESASTAVLKITRVESRGGELVLTGTISNPAEFPTQIGLPGGSSGPEGVNSAYLGTVEIKQGNEWEWLGPWKCGAAPMISLKPHGEIRFRKKTGIPYPAQRGQYRLSFSDQLTTEFEAGP